jgi:hypothetical protein
MGCWFEGVRLDPAAKRQKKAHGNRILRDGSINILYEILLWMK